MINEPKEPRGATFDLLRIQIPPTGMGSRDRYGQRSVVSHCLIRRVSDGGPTIRGLIQVAPGLIGNERDFDLYFKKWETLESDRI